MALIIKGDMPTGCKNCWFAELETGGRNFFCIKQIGKRFSVELAEQRQEGCPIIGEIPDEHGRLVDADELKKDALCCGSKFQTSFIRRITVAPTVVEASK